MRHRTIVLPIGNRFMLRYQVVESFLSINGEGSGQGSLQCSCGLPAVI